MTEIAYINKKGNRVVLEMTYHAEQRMRQRWPIVHSAQGIPDDLRAYVARVFESGVDRVTKLNRREKERVKKHKGATLFFRAGQFTYVVQGNAIVTIELHDKNKRHLNKTT